MSETLKKYKDYKIDKQIITKKKYRKNKDDD